MKTQLIIFFIILLSYSCDRTEPIKPVEGWQKMESPTQNGLTDVEFLNDDFGVICGGLGTLLITENAGQEWLTLNVDVNSSFSKIFILNENEFYSSTKGLYKTNNGGNTFIELGDLSYSSGKIFEVHFFNSENGLIYKSSSVYKTTDGGQNWYEVYDRGGFCYKMQFPSDSIGYIAGGASWDGMSYGELHKTIDGGNTWADIGTGITNSEIMSFYFFSENIGYLTNYYKELYLTNDGGENWNLVLDTLPSIFADMVFLTSNEGYGVGQHNAIYKTTDGGKNWTEDYKDSSMVFTDITYTPNETIFVVGNNGIILKKEKL